MKQLRKVIIVVKHGSIFVNYAERRKHQRYGAAQFDAKHHTVADVEKWVRDNSEELGITL